MDAVIHHRDDSAEDLIVLIVLNFTELQHESIFWPLTFSFVFSADRLQEMFCSCALYSWQCFEMQYYMLQNIFTYFKNQNWEYKKIIRNYSISKVKVDVIDGRSVWVDVGIGYADDWHDWVYLWCWKSPESCVVNVEKFSVVILRKCNSSANTQQMFRTLAPSTVVRLQFLTLPPTWLGNVTSTLLTGILHKPVYL